MTDERWVVLGLAHPRAGWFSELARWATSAAVPIEFVKCVSPDEVRARLHLGRAYSALLVGDGVVGLDRDLVDCVRRAGAAVIAVDPVSSRDWSDLGVTGLLEVPFDRADLLSVLRRSAQPVAPTPSTAFPAADHEPEPAWRGRLLAVTGPGGTGTSVLAMALAQSFAAEPGNRAMVVLADLALAADQGMLHDAGDVTPGIQELCEAHRGARMTTEQIRRLAFDTVDRRYHLLLGLRRRRDWTAIRPRALEAALEGLVRSYRMVIADVDADVEGEAETGSRDVEDRNLMARTATGRADVVVVVGAVGTKGIHSLGRTVRELVEAGVEPGRIVTVCNRAPRSRLRRSEATRALALVTGGGPTSTAIGNPVFVAHRSDVEDAIVDGAALPRGLARPLHDAVARRLAELAPDARAHTGRAHRAPEPVQPGALGSWAGESA